ncbi:ABC transporter ATP-binding protein [Clostridium sp. 'deep sea']|uniref:ABC transporter ATP-binding protein n=1 Tax=Clostridium sp. 'deep sea' TaxID=2779445 RepID=UPI0018965ED6|nr:ABC transporter ATP-binding protein [Clostridium sp. 'deep sea']QOR36623.1 ABC transporter ATP-binding protein [Clostridium sp. 'deep sea']
MNIICKDISKVIKNKKIIKNISFNVNEGEIFGLVGPNGAGKTTLIRLILNLYNLSNGDIWVNGISVSSKSFLKLKSDISVLLDSLCLYKDLTAWENIEFFDRIYYNNSTMHDRKKRIQESLKKVGLLDNKNDKIIFFSKGMRQRLALARAFNANAKLLILDEPTIGLDVDGQLMIREQLLQLQKRKTTIIISSHNLNELQKICKRYAFIKDGKLKASGTLTEINNSILLDTNNTDLETIYKGIMDISDNGQ